MLLSKAVEQERGGAQRIIGVAGSVNEDAIMTSEGRSAFLWGVCLLTLRLPRPLPAGARSWTIPGSFFGSVLIAISSFTPHLFHFLQLTAPTSTAQT